MRAACIVLLAGCGFQGARATVDGPPGPGSDAAIDSDVSVDLSPICSSIALGSPQFVASPCATPTDATLVVATSASLDTDTGTSTPAGITCVRTTNLTGNLCAVVAPSIVIPFGVTLSAHGSLPLALFAHSLTIRGTVDVASHVDGSADGEGMGEQGEREGAVSGEGDAERDDDRRCDDGAEVAGEVGGADAGDAGWGRGAGVGVERGAGRDDERGVGGRGARGGDELRAAERDRRADRAEIDADVGVDRGVGAGAGRAVDGGPGALEAAAGEEDDAGCAHGATLRRIGPRFSYQFIAGSSMAGMARRPQRPSGRPPQGRACWDGLASVSEIAKACATVCRIPVG